MNRIATKLNGTYTFSGESYYDARGSVYEGFDLSSIRKSEGLSSFNPIFSFEIHSRKDVLRGLHYQAIKPQQRLVRISQGVVYEVIVDVRTDSETFGCWDSFMLSEDKMSSIFIPKGVAHGFYTLSEKSSVIVYSDVEWVDDYQRTIKWNDTSLKIQWPNTGTYPVMIPPIISDRDERGLTFKEILALKEF
jgi:dTDP-4-dehydrorhamnose 3,5-epimerase